MQFRLGTDVPPITLPNGAKGLRVKKLVLDTPRYSVDDISLVFRLEHGGAWCEKWWPLFSFTNLTGGVTVFNIGYLHTTDDFAPSSFALLFGRAGRGTQEYSSIVGTIEGDFEYGETGTAQGRTA
jgi:hypothetical protein